MRRARPTGGTARLSMRSCSMRPAPPRASSGVIPTCAGCAARAIPPSWRPSRPRCWPRSGRSCGPAAACSTAPAQSSAKRVRNKSMRFLHTTPTRDCSPRRAICCPKAGRMPVASRTILWVTTTASSTRCLKNSRPEPVRPRSPLLRAALLLVWVLLLAWLPAAAQGRVAASITQMRLEQADDGVYLSAAVQFELPSLVEDVLDKGIAIYFVAEAELYQERWYWADRKVAD